MEWWKICATLGVVGPGVLGLLAGPAPAIAAHRPHCTTEPRSAWLSSDDMRSRAAAMGYAVDVFKTTSDGCYEIYGRDHTGKRVEVYFDPVNAEIVWTGR